MKIPQVNIDEFNKNGFSLIKNVLSPGEIEILRSEAYRTIEEDKKKGTFIKHRDATNHIGCLTNIEPFKKLILDDRVVSIAEQVLGEKPTFFGDGIFEIGVGSRGFHKDTSNRDNPNHPDWTEDYPVIRIAFYLEDHHQYSGGLKVRLGSQNTVSTKKGKAMIVPSQAGDAVVFSLRTSHAGNAVRLNMFPNLSMHHSLEKRVPNFMKLPEQKERVSFFLTYGLPSGALDRFMEFMFKHNVYSKRIVHSEYPETLQSEIKEKLNFINIRERYEKFQSS